MQAIIVVALIIAALGAVLWFLPGSPLSRLANPPQQAVVPGAVADGESVGPSRELKIVSVLPRDAIPAIMHPRFVSGEKAHAQMQPHSRVIGLSINGDHRAYSTAHLNSHEVVNDTVGGVPVAVTW